MHVETVALDGGRQSVHRVAGRDAVGIVGQHDADYLVGRYR